MQAQYQSAYKIWVRFNDGSEGVIDLKDQLDGEIFTPLRNIEQFKSFHVDSELQTLVWPNGADLAPEFLQELLQVAA